MPCVANPKNFSMTFPHPNLGIMGSPRDIGQEQPENTFPQHPPIADIPGAIRTPRGNPNLLIKAAVFEELRRSWIAREERTANNREETPPWKPLLML
jgi:hypothetical protein